MNVLQLGLKVDWFCFFVLLIGCVTTAQLFAGEPIVIPPDGPALFIDDALIETQYNLHRTLHQPVKDFGGNQPVIALNDEFAVKKGVPAFAGSTVKKEVPAFAGTLEANGSIVYDPKIQKYVMFALAFSVEGREVHPERRWEFYRICRFTSVDGINWVKGDDGQPQIVFPRVAEDLFDPISGVHATNIDQFCCFYDAHAEFPYQAWQYFSNWEGDREGVYFLQSRDGITWERGSQVVNAYADKSDPVYRKIQQDGHTLVGPGDVTHFYRDPLEPRFLGVFKFYSPQPVENGNLLRSRAFTFFDHPLSAAFDLTTIRHVALVPPAAHFNNEHPTDEYYGSAAWRYGPLWLGELKIWHAADDYPWSAAGCAFLKLVVSRDGLHWTKVPFTNEAGQPEVFLANGPEGGHAGQNDGGYMTLFNQGPLRLGDELIFYYGSSSFGKNHPANRRISGGGIFRARLRPDGFVSVDAGTLTTPLLTLPGKYLVLNAIGPVQVEILSSTGEQLGLTTVTGDSLRHRVNFNGRMLGEFTQSQPVRLRFSIGGNGRLYSFLVR